MREKIIARLEEIRERENNFSWQTMRWRGMKYNDIPLGILRFEILNDEQLLDMYERIVRRLSKQM